MVIIFILLFFNIKIEALEPYKSYDKLYISDNDQTFETVDIYLLFFKKKKLDNLIFLKSNIVGLHGQGLKFTNFRAVNTTFKAAKLAGSNFKNCEFSNVTFIDSDLSFSNIKKCKLNNVNFINTIEYEISKF